jgi:UDP-N-acetylglucosamine--N-acetylmuramyl-(pentapeptide) pyrophosphoryl-undecaprenol N-acetylglucosamine transferase
MKGISMRLIVSAGATGGGINPALAVLQALADKPEEVLWVGSIGGIENDLVDRAGVPFTAIPAAGLHGVGLKIFKNSWQLLRGYFAARKLIREFKPDVLFFTGGFVAIPIGLAGRKIPIVLCVPDIEPAMALKTLARFADRIAVPTPDSLGYFSKDKEVTVVGYPTRPELKVWDRMEAFAQFELSPEKPTLLVTGGSLGALSINRAMISILPELLREMQVIHLTGNRTWPEVEAAMSDLPDDLAKNYRAYPFLYEAMGAAFTAADLVVSRAGASVIGELPHYRLPAILVPYPYAWRYQKINAEYLSSKNAAVIVRDEDLSVELLPMINTLLSDDQKRKEMQSAMQSLATPHAAAQIGELLVELASPLGGAQ